MNRKIEQMIQLVHLAKPLIMDQSMSHDITVKGQADFVTKVDTAVQRFLQKELYKRYPEVTFMGEEDHKQNADFSKPVWILDPVDGTTNLIYGYCHSAVSLGYYEEGHISGAVIYNPFSEETFYAERGQGAFFNNRPVRVTDHKALQDSLIAIGTSPYNKEMAPVNFKSFQRIFERSLDIRRSGSAALDLAYVACGRLDGYFERNLKPWDFAAGSLILEEAGGRVTDFQLGPVDVTSNQDIIATNGWIHEELQSLLPGITSEDCGPQQHQR